MQRRAQRVDSSRQLDFFADLNLGPSDDEGVAQDDSETAVESAAITIPSTRMGGLLDTDIPDGTGLPEVFGNSHVFRKDGKRRAQKKRKGKGKGPERKANKWADKCMYAELLEMLDDPRSDLPGNGQFNDGLPADLETSWVAVAPVPLGKRCLAVTHQSSGLMGIGQSFKFATIFHVS